MKRIVLMTVSFVMVMTVSAQVTKTAPKTPVKAPVKTPLVLKTQLDSVSYIIGVGVANYFKGVGVNKINPTLMCKAVDDSYAGKKTLVDDNTSNVLVSNYINTKYSEKQSGTKTPAAKPAAPPKPSKELLKSYIDSVDYCIGMNVSTSYKGLGIPKINTNMLSRGMTDKFGGKPTLISDSTANVFMNDYITKLMAEKSKGNIEAGEKFLAANKEKPGVKTTETGLQYEVVTEGTGVKPIASDNVTVHYRGTFIDGNGFDNSYDRGQPITFSLGAVIKGWTEGLQLMSVGSKYKFYIPYQLAYGAHDYNSIPGGSALVFEVELLDVKKQ